MSNYSLHSFFYVHSDKEEKLNKPTAILKIELRCNKRLLR